MNAAKENVKNGKVDNNRRSLVFPLSVVCLKGNVRRRRGRAIGLIPQLTDKHTHTQLPAHLKTHTHGNATFTIGTKRESPINVPDGRWWSWERPLERPEDVFANVRGTSSGLHMGTFGGTFAQAI
ncbi:hypothetical protein F2P79_025196 [Pimephales promelas]|nr:hypothetical protein F2P79_025382 [Pimephales promelas]KAG1925927.1 hypothetical protein F2P79_025196 [Pimephales promelas]